MATTKRTAKKATAKKKPTLKKVCRKVIKREGVKTDGTLKKGYKYVKGGRVVKVKAAKPTAKKKIVRKKKAS